MAFRSTGVSPVAAVSRGAGPYSGQISKSDSDLFLFCQ